MFDDPNKDLKRMERRLLEVEEEEQWLDAELADVYRLLEEDDRRQPEPDLDATQVYRREEMPVRNFANGYGRNGDLPDSRRMAEQYRDEEEDWDGLDAYIPREKSNRGLVLLAVLETLGIVGIVMYWLVKLL